MQIGDCTKISFSSSIDLFQGIDILCNVTFNSMSMYSISLLELATSQKRAHEKKKKKNILYYY